MRRSAKAIIIRDGKLAMVYSGRGGYYEFPGGGIEAGEDHAAALIREIREETGLIVKPDTIRELGSVLALRKSRVIAGHIFEQEIFYYFCDAEDTAAEPSLEDYEAEEGLVLRYVVPEEALRANALAQTEDKEVMLEREKRILKIVGELCCNKM